MLAIAIGLLLGICSVSVRVQKEDALQRRIQAFGMGIRSTPCYGSMADIRIGDKSNNI